MRKDLLLSILQQLARPLVALCLRHGIRLGELIDCMKRVYVRAAEEMMRREGQSVSISRISVMTGVHRTDVATIQKEGTFAPREHHTASEVISRWRYHSDFCSKPGKPRSLSCDGLGSEFADLVRSVSRSLSPYTVSFELERLGMVERTRDGKIRLVSRAFVPKGDPRTVLEMLGEDADDLFVAVEENAFTPADGSVPNHHLKTEYTNVPAEALPEIRSWFFREGSALHERARNFLSTYDRDINPNATGTKRFRVGVLSVSRIAPLSNEEEKK